MGTQCEAGVWRTAAARRPVEVEYAAGARAAGCDPRRLAVADQLVSEAAERGVFPGAALVVVRHGDTALARGYGRLGYGVAEAPADIDTIYDLASLTKVVATTTVAMQMVAEGRLDLDVPAVRYLPAFGTVGTADSAAKRTILVRDLLAHCSGLPPTFPGHFPLYARANGIPRERETIVATALQIGLDSVPRTRAVYSDLGAIVLGAVIEAIADQRLDELAEARVFAPLELKATRFRPPWTWLPRIAPTERDPWRRRVLRGEVHDECAWAMGGVSAHAGLFGSARDLAVFGQALLTSSRWGAGRLVDANVLAEFTRPDIRVPGSDRGLGWQMATGANSAGPSLSPSAFGHTGFTGTSLWIDPERDLVVVLLSNRVHPRRENVGIIGLRPALHDAIVAALVD